MVLVYTRAVLLLPPQQEMLQAHGFNMWSPENGYVIGDSNRGIGPR